MNPTLTRAAFLVLAGLSLSACSSLLGDVMSSAGSSAANSAGSAAGNQVGTAAGNQAGNAAVSRWGGSGAAGGGGAAMNPQMQQQMSMIYTQYLFSMAFGAGGYAVATVPYTPGQYTRWNLTGGQSGKGAIMEQAHLFDDKDGNQWWKVKWTGEEGKETIILEALLSPKDQKMLRLRGKFPNDTEGKEMAVTDNATYVPPQKLSKQSIEGATVGSESVAVPAGTFNARKVVYGDMAQTHEWYLVDTVPGGMVRQVTKVANKSDEHHMGMDLAAFGNDAKTELGTHN